MNRCPGTCRRSFDREDVTVIASGRRRGHTLLELVISMALGAMLVAGLASALLLAGRTLDAGASTAVKRVEAAQTLRDVLTDAGQALHFSERTATAIAFTVPDRDGDDVPETVRYSWTGTAGAPLLMEYNGNSAEVLIDDVQQFDLSYLTRTLVASSSGGSTPGTVTFHEFTEGKLGSNDTDVFVATPSGTAAGDLLIAAVATDGNTRGSLAAPPGWTVITVDRRGNAVTLGVWWKIAGASEPADHQFSWSGRQRAYGWIMRFTGHDPATPINAWAKAGQGNNGSPTSPSVTSTVDNTMILRLGAFDDDDVTLDSPGLAGHTPITMDESSAGNGTASGGAGYILQAAAGSSGTSNFLLTAKEQSRKVTIAIAPNPGG